MCPLKILECAPLKQWIWIKCAPWKHNKINLCDSALFWWNPQICPPKTKILNQMCPLITQNVQTLSLSEKQTWKRLKDLCAFLMFMVEEHGLYLICALLSRIKLCRDYALFRGHFWPKFDGRGHENILKDRANPTDLDPNKFWVEMGVNSNLRLRLGDLIFWAKF